MRNSVVAILIFSIFVLAGCATVPLEPNPNVASALANGRGISGKRLAVCVNKQSSFLNYNNEAEFTAFTVGNLLSNLYGVVYVPCRCQGNGYGNSGYVVSSNTELAAKVNVIDNHYYEKITVQIEVINRRGESLAWGEGSAMSFYASGFAAGRNNYAAASGSRSAYEDILRSAAVDAINRLKPAGR